MTHADNNIYEHETTVKILWAIGRLGSSVSFCKASSGEKALDKIAMAYRWVRMAISHQLGSDNIQFRHPVDKDIMLTHVWMNGGVPKSQQVQSPDFTNHCITEAECIADAILQMLPGYYPDVEHSTSLKIKECYSGARVNLMEAALILRFQLKY